ncbi:MAG TPA: prenyltransferase/squalene oxidase repeat-containing protein, partial [Planctomycetaceae bacterium]|nr:prenyltransferase/squalene oxidase repeat-containing protein [Planctomycetaceae bacterium]
VPTPVKAGETGPVTESRIPLEVEAPERSARPEIAIPETPLDRTIPTIAQEDSIIERSTQAGASKRIDIDPVPQLAAPDLVRQPDAVFERTEDSENLAFQKGPTPSIRDTPEFGTEVETEQTQGKVGDNNIPDLKRTILAEPLGIAGGSMERQRPNFAPSTPQPRSEGLEVTPNLPELPFPSIGSTLPNVVKPEFDLPVQKPGQLPDTYRLRDLERRSEMAERFGGTQESEKAVENSLAWLARHQSAAGFWDADRYGAGRGPESDVAGLNLSAEQKKVRQESGIKADTGVTALALLTFLAAGYTNEEGQYAANVDRAINWLIDRQRSDGYLGGEATYFAANYCHGMATYALAEALGMQSDPKSAPRLRAAVQKGVNYTVGMQLSADGGWRYNRNSSEGDMSIFGWQLMALKSAEIAGLPIPAEASERMIHFLQLRSQGADKGLASYRTGEPPSPAMTAEALFCKQILGIRRSNPQSIQAVGYLLQQPPKLSEWNLYYWYYGTLAMYQYGGTEWETWNRSMRKVLTESQRTEGDNAGSWDPVGPWGPYGGRVYSTAMATLCLEVYYRFLPLYEHGGRFDE